LAHRALPRLSQADLWVLAAYVAVEVLGGPRIAFTGGRFDAKDGSRAPFGDAPSYEGRYKGNTPKVYNPQGSRLLPLDLGPKEGVYVKSGVASNPAREEPTVAAFRAHAKRMGLSDRELVALLLGGESCTSLLSFYFLFFSNVYREKRIESLISLHAFVLLCRYFSHFFLEGT